MKIQNGRHFRQIVILVIFVLASQYSITYFIFYFLVLNLSAQIIEHELFNPNETTNINRLLPKVVHPDFLNFPNGPRFMNL